MELHHVRTVAGQEVRPCPHEHPAPFEQIASEIRPFDSADRVCQRCLRDLPRLAGLGAEPVNDFETVTIAIY